MNLLLRIIKLLYKKEPIKIEKTQTFVDETLGFA